VVALSFLLWIALKVWYILTLVANAYGENIHLDKHRSVWNIFRKAGDFLANDDNTAAQKSCKLLYE
jgi:hypothetical protein